MTETMHHAYLVDGDQFECVAVEEECPYRAKVVAGIRRIGLVNGERDGGVGYHPTQFFEIRQIWYEVLFGMHRGALIRSVR